MFGVRPDLTTFGRIIGGGLPIGAFCGRKEIMSLVAPQGPVYQAGTFSGNPLSLAAGIATVRWLHNHPSIYPDLAEKVRAIEESLGTGKNAGGSFVRMARCSRNFFRNKPPQNYIEVKECDTTAFFAFWQKTHALAILLPQFETNFLSAAHTKKDLELITGGYVRDVLEGRDPGQQACARTDRDGHKKDPGPRYRSRTEDHQHAG